LIPLPVTIVVADRFSRSAGGGGGLRAGGIALGLFVGVLAGGAVVALARARVLVPALQPALDRDDPVIEVGVGHPAEAVSPRGLVGSIGAIRQEDRIAALLGLVSTRLEALSGRQLGRVADRPGAPLVARRQVAAADVAEVHRCALRVERVATSLRLFAGHDLGPRPGRDQPVRGVARRALAACEEPARIDCSALEPALVAGEVADDLALMVAELVDNALRWADDGTVVALVGRRFGDGYSLAVVDEGVDLDADARRHLNDELWAPPSLAVNPPASFGLPVVGRLAVRHGLEVRLMEAATDGVIAKIRLPATLVRDRPAQTARSAARAGSNTVATSWSRSSGSLISSAMSATPSRSATARSTGSPARPDR
jgi:hypothetical protein